MERIHEHDRQRAAAGTDSLQPLPGLVIAQGHLDAIEQRARQVRADVQVQPVAEGALRLPGGRRVTTETGVGLPAARDLVLRPDEMEQDRVVTRRRAQRAPAKLKGRVTTGGGAVHERPRVQQRRHRLPILRDEPGGGLVRERRQLLR